MRDAGRNIVEAVICIRDFWEVCWHCSGPEAETVWYLVLGGRLLWGVKSGTLELVSRWKKRQSGTKQEAMGRPQESRVRKTGDVFSGISESEGLKTEIWNMESQSDTEQQGWRDSSVEKKRENMGKRMKNRKTERCGLMELEGMKRICLEKRNTDQPGG